MIHKITDRTQALVFELGELGREVDRDQLLRAASWTARQEWSALRLRWPTALEIEAGAITLSDEELAMMAGKVRRFKSILQALQAPQGVRVSGEAALGAP